MEGNRHGMGGAWAAGALRAMWLQVGLELQGRREQGEGREEEGGEEREVWAGETICALMGGMAPGRVWLRLRAASVFSFKILIQ